MLRTITIKELRPSLPAVMDAVDKRLDRFVVTRRGRRVAVIVSPDDLEGLLETLEILEDRAGVRRMKKAKREVQEGRTRPLDEIRRSLERV